jgi:hypothetical protein
MRQKISRCAISSKSLESFFSFITYVAFCIHNAIMEISRLEFVDTRIAYIWSSVISDQILTTAKYNERYFHLD